MQRIKGSAELRLTEIALAILRNENRAFPLFKVVWLRNRIVCEQFRLDVDAFKRFENQLVNCNKIVAQKRLDKNKIYSLHEPETACIAKGKAHKKFEFGSKISFAVVSRVNIIVGVKNSMD